MKITGFHRFFQKLAALRFNSWWLSKLLYRIDPITEGTLEVEISLLSTPTPGAVNLTILDPGGNEIAQFAIADTVATITQAVSTDYVFLSLESTDWLTYSLFPTFEQVPITVSSLSPMSGGVGTTVNIKGSGLAHDPDKTYVLFASHVPSIRDA